MFLLVSCTIAVMESADRNRLARAVIARRVELGMKTTKALADKAGLSARMLGDVENGRRDNFSDGAKAQIEQALGWDPGSIDDILDGKSPTVSFVLRSRDGEQIQQSRSIDGYEQGDLELYRLASIILDARDLVRSQRGPMMTALAAVLDEASDLVTKVVARQMDDDRDIDHARWFIEETRAANDIRRRGDIYVVDPTVGSGKFIDVSFGAVSEAAKDGAIGEEAVAKEALLSHYRQMYKMALGYAHRTVLIEQERSRLGDRPDSPKTPEIADHVYVQYVAARLSSLMGGGGADIHDAVSLSPSEYSAARARYEREFAELAVFRRLMTIGAPLPQLLAEDEPLPAAARSAVGQSEGRRRRDAQDAAAED